MNRANLFGLKVEANEAVPDGRQVWLRGREVVAITSDERAKFYAMFGLMKVPAPEANRVLLSPADFASLLASARLAEATR